MSDVTPNPSEEAVAKPTEGGENEDEKEFENLFGDDLDFEDESKTIEELKEEFKAYKEEKRAEFEKNKAKFFSQKGMELGKKKEEAVTQKKEETPSDVTLLFFESKPEAETVKDEILEIAKLKGISEIQVWKANTFGIQEKAKALYAEKTETEQNRGRVGSPSSFPAKGMTEVEKIAKRLSDGLPPGFSASKPKLN